MQYLPRPSVVLAQTPLVTVSESLKVSQTPLVTVSESLKLSNGSKDGASHISSAFIQVLRVHEETENATRGDGNAGDGNANGRGRYADETDTEGLAFDPNPEPVTLPLKEGSDNGTEYPPVNEMEGGEGPPYAPPGWRWRVGRRQANGTWTDRYFYPPGGKREFASKKQVEQYLKYTQPGIDLDVFWETYRWRIPAVEGSGEKRRLDSGSDAAPHPFTSDTVKHGEVSRGSSPAEQRTESGSPGQGDPRSCPKQYALCGLVLGKAAILDASKVAPCDICCVEEGFCRTCNCIFCNGDVRGDGAGPSNVTGIWCSRSSGNGFCGHAAHLRCALGNKAAISNKKERTVNYLCRRCDETNILSLDDGRPVSAAEPAPQQSQSTSLASGTSKREPGALEVLPSSGVRGEAEAERDPLTSDAKEDVLKESSHRHGQSSSGNLDGETAHVASSEPHTEKQAEEASEVELARALLGLPDGVEEGAPSPRDLEQQAQLEARSKELLIAVSDGLREGSDSGGSTPGREGLGGFASLAGRRILAEEKKGVYGLRKSSSQQSFDSGYSTNPDEVIDGVKKKRGRARTPRKHKISPWARAPNSDEDADEQLAAEVLAGQGLGFEDRNIPPKKRGGAKKRMEPSIEDAHLASEDENVRKSRFVTDGFHRVAAKVKKEGHINDVSMKRALDEEEHIPIPLASKVPRASRSARHMRVHISSSFLFESESPAGSDSQPHDPDLRGSPGVSKRKLEAGSNGQAPKRKGRPPGAKKESANGRDLVIDFEADLDRAMGGGFSAAKAWLHQQAGLSPLETQQLTSQEERVQSTCQLLRQQVEAFSPSGRTLFTGLDDVIDELKIAKDNARHEIGEYHKVVVKLLDNRGVHVQMH